MQSDSGTSPSSRRDRPSPPAVGLPPAAALAVLALVGSLGVADALGPAPATAAAGGAAEGRADDGPCATAEHRRFDFWIGEWDVINRQRNPARPDDETLHPTGTATNRVYAILDGCAVVEHWEGHLVPDRHVLGFSVRAWDPERDAWVALLNWPGAGGPSFYTMEGGFADSMATFTAETSAGRRVRYRFRDIRADRLRWVGARRGPDAEAWSPFWVMEFRRRDPTRDPALFNGPARGTERCPGERARSYDFLVGDWVGEAVVPGDRPEGGSRPVTLRAWPILEGCAVMEFLAVGEGEERSERFRVRSFVPGEGRWVQYTVRQASPVMVRWEGSADDDRTLTRVGDAGDPAAPARRALYRDIGPDAFVREVQERPEGDDRWSTVSRTRLRRR